MPARFDRLFVALAILAGLLIGFAASTFAYRYRWLHVPREGFMDRMDQDLDLTPAQHAQIRQVFEDTRAGMEDLQRQFEHQRNDLLSQTSDRIHAILTPDQQKKFDTFFRHGESISHHVMEPYPHHGENPPPPP